MCKELKSQEREKRSQEKKVILENTNQRIEEKKKVDKHIDSFQTISLNESFPTK